MAVATCHHSPGSLLCSHQSTRLCREFVTENPHSTRWSINRPQSLTRYDNQRDAALGRERGCQPPPELTKRWPLGIDRIKELWTSNADGRLLAFLCSIAAGYEPRNNLSQFLLIGPRAFHILHPQNVEALLSTNFTGE